ncbi:MAG: Flp family type IVb pilin, partial [Clostridiales bacterium]|nr:Flp family type IVb pilin [Candidatus Apopatocola equi]
WNDESGQGMVEYALIIALIAIVMVVALTNVADGIKAKFQEVADTLGGGGGAEGGEG